VNEYELLRELGAGATAVVKLCRRVGAPRVDADGGGNGVLYAVKIFQKNVLRKQVDFGARPGEMVKETGLHKLQREIAIMKKLIHPNIVRLIEVIDDEGGDCGYLVMEYVSGKSNE
jgi:calcium/calmodulin-dependent protein kinase kinase 2